MKLGMAALVLALLCVFGLANTPFYLKERAGHHKATCLTSLKQMAQAVQLYLADNDGAYPVATEWCDRIVGEDSAASSLVCPDARNQRWSYAYNGSLAGQRSDSLDDPSVTILLFESDAGWNAAGAARLLPEMPRHAGGDNIAFMDGHCAWLPRQRAAPPAGAWAQSYTAQVRWAPAHKAR